MGRLIEQQAVIDCLTNTAEYYDMPQADEWTKGIHYGLLHGIDNILDNVKPVEAIPKADYENRLKKGKWIAHRKSNGEVGYFQCTSCDHHSVVKFPYCPICGAEMDCNPNILSEMKAIPRDMYENRLKADMAAMLTELDLEIDEIEILKSIAREDINWNMGAKAMREKIKQLIQERINALRGGENDK